MSESSSRHLFHLPLGRFVVFSGFLVFFVLFFPFDIQGQAESEPTGTIHMTVSDESSSSDMTMPIQMSASSEDIKTRVQDAIRAALDQESGHLRDGMVVLGKSITVRTDETLTDSLVVFGGSATVNGNIDGDIVIFGGNATISGVIDGDVIIIGGSVTLKSTAVINGSVLYIGGKLTQDDGAVVAEDPINLTFHPFFSDDDEQVLTPSLFRIGFIFNTIALVWWGCISFLVSLIFNRQIDRAAHVMLQDPVRAALAGFAFHVIAAATTIFLIIILIGIPLSLFAFLAWFLTCVFAIPVGFAALGRILYTSMNRPQTSILITCLTGFIILALIRFLPYFLGFFIWHAWALAAIGATILSRFGTMKAWLRKSDGTV